MRVLLDTHMVLWYHSADRALPARANSIIRSELNESFVSIVSLWEISVKHSIGKLPLQMPLPDFIKSIHIAGFKPLDLSLDHVAAVGSLPTHHRDPFDRMLIAQAKCEGMHVLSIDPNFKLYDVPLVDL